MSRLEEIAARVAAATPGPWKWRTDQNGQGSVATHLDSRTGEWESCEYYCFGWDEGDETHRGPQNTPGHEHLTDPTVLYGDGWHGSGDVRVEPADAAFIAAARDDVPFLLEEVERLRAVLRLHNQTPTGKVRKCLPGCIACALLAAPPEASE